MAENLSKVVRFEVFRRDGFKCRYCGRQAPEVLLHCDHVLPRSLGGSDDVTNLVCSCSDCNLGKRDRPLAGTEELRRELAEASSARESVVRNYRRVFKAADKGKAMELESQIRAAFEKWVSFGPDGDGDDMSEYFGYFHKSAKRFLKELTPEQVDRAIDYTMEKRDGTYQDDKFRYFCAVCWNQIRLKRDPEFALRWQEFYGKEMVCM